jgi:hypothetical protein
MAADLLLAPLSTLVGATAAILGGSVTVWINDWRREARDRKQLAASLAGELRGFKTLFDMYQPGVKLRRLETQTDGRFAETLAGVIPLRGVYFQVFDANASKIGLLSPGLADSVSVVYVLLRALSEEFPRLEELHKQRMGPEHLKSFHEQLISLTQEARERTEDVITKLRIYAGLPPD